MDFGKESESTYSYAYSTKLWLSSQFVYLLTAAASFWALKSFLAMSFRRLALSASSLSGSAPSMCPETALRYFWTAISMSAVLLLGFIIIHFLSFSSAVLIIQF